MTQAKMSSSPPFMDFGYEPGTLVIGRMCLNWNALNWYYLLTSHNQSFCHTIFYQ
ncbi:hypothetical protein IQ244_23955 [Nostoc sp. LEGE 06077]|nr:hypothetical protein [Nostoc sp. LEGE 06077]